MNNPHPWQLKKSKSWQPCWSYQLSSTANLVNLDQFWGKWAGLAVLFNWQLQNGSQNCPGCRIFILYEIHCYLCPHIFMSQSVYNGKSIKKVTFSFIGHMKQEFLLQNSKLRKKLVLGACLSCKSKKKRQVCKQEGQYFDSKLPFKSDSVRLFIIPLFL